MKFYRTNDTRPIQSLLASFLRGQNDENLRKLGNLLKDWYHIVDLYPDLCLYPVSLDSEILTIGCTEDLEDNRIEEIAGTIQEERGRYLKVLGIQSVEVIHID